MNRGDLYLVKKPGQGDPKRQRIFVVVSRSGLLDTPYSTLICAPVYSSYHGLETQVQLDHADGMKDACAIHCDNLMSVPRKALTDYRGRLSPQKMEELDTALAEALGVR